MIVDTSALLAYFDANEPAHDAVAEAIENATAPLVVSPYVVAEVDYLVLSRHGVQEEQAVLAELGGGAWELAHVDSERLARAQTIVRRFADVPIGVTDASLIVLAEAYGTREIVTLDRRRFGMLRFTDGSAPRILPEFD